MSLQNALFVELMGPLSPAFMKLHICWKHPQWFKITGFALDGKHVSWIHLAEFHKLDVGLDLRLAPKITGSHIELPAFSSMRVPLAAQTLSRSVAKGMEGLRKLNRLPESSQFTTRFINRFDKLFNVFNSSASKSHKGKYAHLLTNNSSHWNSLYKMPRKNQRE